MTRRLDACQGPFCTEAEGDHDCIGRIGRKRWIYALVFPLQVVLGGLQIRSAVDEWEKVNPRVGVSRRVSAPHFYSLS